MRIFLYVIFFLLVGSPLHAEDAKKKRLSDKQITKLIIKDSIQSYDGNCPCPYSRKSNGHRCGGSSAWSRDNGESPMCYSSDVTAEMIAEYRKKEESK